MNEPNPPITQTDILRSVILVDVYKHEDSLKILFGIMQERSYQDDPYVNISHRTMPTWREHVNFFESKPYRRWYLIQAVSWDTEKKIYLEPGSLNYATEIVGTCYLTRQNEIGIVLFGHYRGRGFGTKAVHLLTTKHKPLPAIPGKRSGRFMANINPANEKSIALFSKLGFTHLSDTYVL